MTLEQLLYFVSIAETKSAHKTAEQFYISPQAISKALKNLEKEFNTVFLSFTKQGTFLTENGKIFLNYALTTIDGYNTLKRTFVLNNSYSNAVTNLNISCQTRLYENNFFPILLNFNQQFSEIQTSIEAKASAKDIFSDISQRKTDFGICLLSEIDVIALQNNPTPFDFTILPKKELFCCIHKDHTTATQKFLDSVPENSVNFPYVSPFYNLETISSVAIVLSSDIQMRLITLTNGCGTMFQDEFEKYFTDNADFKLLPFQPANFMYPVCLHRNISLMSSAELLFLETLKQTFNCTAGS